VKVLSPWRAALLTTAACAVSGVAGAQLPPEVLITDDIAVSTTWTKNNVYNLTDQVFVLPGATLTIEAGTILASEEGSLAVMRGAQIFVQGTADEPVIMTSKADTLTWVNGDPKTGTWREAANEWGNLTIMGRAFVSEDAIPTNTSFPDAGNFAIMEGLLVDPSDPLANEKVRYGGGDDDDDSGSVQYLSIRFGGKVIGIGDELNGLSLGGIGRGTDLSFIEIMNNVDDGIEIWGGPVNIKNFAIWNIGDDSFDLDQGWRGKAQFGLIVQGHSLDAPSGSGVCDNMIEIDGAENSDHQPVTTVTLYNMTLIGQPIAGDHATAWRDNARMQIRNSIIMDTGRNVVNLDNVDGDGGQGYGFNGTLTWLQTWATPYNAVPSHPNDAAPGLPGWIGYQAQTSGFLSEISDSVFFRNNNPTAYNEANNVGVFSPANNNVLVAGSAPADAPIRYIQRGAPVVKGGRTLLPVEKLDPRPANDALTSVAAAPNDGFFTPAFYRGAFAPGENWALGWTAADAFGFFSEPADVTPLTSALNVPSSFSTNGVPSIGNSSFALVLDNPTASCGVVPGSFALLVVGSPSAFPIPLFGYGCDGGFGELLLFPLVNPVPFAFKPYLGAPVNFPLPIPDQPSLIGGQFGAQGAFLLPDFASFRLANGALLTVGS
jgi:hypothetical protein